MTYIVQEKWKRADKFVRAHIHLCYATDGRFCFDCQEMTADLMRFMDEYAGQSERS